MNATCRCPQCGKSWQVARKDLGRLGKCGHCGHTLTLRESTPADPGTSETLDLPGDCSRAPARAEPQPPARPSSPGDAAGCRRIGRFEIRARLGSGQFGVVWRAYDPLLEREIALKSPHHGRFEEKKDQARALREAKAAAQLRHPHVVPVYEAGTDAEQFYIASALVRGQTLEEMAERRLPDVRTAARIVMDLAGALDYAHRLGIVHRDVKPANIMIDAQGDPQLMDFGLARLAESEEKLTRDGTILGTPAYMPPEQAAGEHDRVGPASDQYSLGVVLYRLLCGQTPFSGSFPSVVFQVIHREPPSPRSLRPGVPRDLETICLKAMSKKLEDRYASCGQLADDLRRWLGGEPIRARRVGIAERLWRWARRNPAVASLSALAAILAVAVVVVISVGYVRTRRALGQSETSLYFNRIALAQQKWLAGEVDQAEPLLDACPKPLRHWEWGYLKRLCHLELRTLRGHTGPVFAVAISPDGTQIASAGADKTLRLWDAASGRQLGLFRQHQGEVTALAFRPQNSQIASAGTDGLIKLWEPGSEQQDPVTCHGHTGRVNGVGFSPDGTRLVSAGQDGSVRIWDPDSGRQLLCFTGREGAEHEGSVAAAAFSPDGAKIVSAGSDGKVRLWNAATGRVERLFEGHAGAVQSAVFSPNGRRIVSGDLDGAVKVWDADTGQPLLSLGTPSAGVGPMALSPDGQPVAWPCQVVFSPDGRRIAATGRDRTVKIWDAESGRERFALRGHAGNVLDVAFSPDGRWIASAGWDHTVKVWDAAGDRRARTLVGHSNYVDCVVFSPDGRQLASAGYDGTARVWEADSGRQRLAFREHEGAVNSLAFSPDGARVASAGSDKTVRIWDAQTGRQLVELRGHRQLVQDVAFSPDGTRLASAGYDKTVKLWSADGGEALRTFPGHSDEVNCVAFSPDGRRVASGSNDGTVKLWETSGGKELLTLEHDGRVSSVAFSPDGRHVASASHDHTVRVWDAETGQEQFRLPHAAWVSSVAYSHDGRRIASGDWDGAIKIWETATGREVLTLRGHAHAVSRAAFSPDGQRLASGSLDGTVKIWDAAPDGP